MKRRQVQKDPKAVTMLIDPQKTFEQSTVDSSMELENVPQMLCYVCCAGTLRTREEWSLEAVLRHPCTHDTHTQQHCQDQIECRIVAFDHAGTP